MEENYRCFKLMTGEIMLTEVDGVNDENMYLLKYPAIVIAIPPEQAGGQQNQIGLGKFIPFASYKEDVLLNANAIAMDSTPDAKLVEMHKQWVNQIRSQESGIIVPNMQQPNIPKAGAPADFSQLNTR